MIFTSLSVSGGGYPTCTVHSKRPLRSLTILPLPAMISWCPAQCSRGPSSLFDREKIIVHPAEEFVHGPLFFIKREVPSK